MEGKIYTDVELAMKGRNLIKFKVGDRVLCTKGKNKGKIGKITGIQREGDAN